MRDKVLSDLPEAAKRLVMEMQRIKFGRIEGLAVRDGLPVFEPKPRVFREVRIGANTPTRPVAAAGNVHLKPEVLELMENLSILGNGVVHSLLVRNGLPFHLEVQE